jgi:3-oxoacyl-[acyl-carrier-protein] synthase-3
VDIGILGISYYLPPDIETNAEVRRQNPDWRLEGFDDQAGIYSRHLAAAGETASDLGYQAACLLLKRSLTPVAEIDYLIFCSQFPDHYAPASACALQSRLGLGRHTGAFDFNLGCSGFVFGLQMARSFIACGDARYVLLITGDTNSKAVHPRDRSVRMLFGDGATATLIGPGDRGARIGTFLLGTDGTGAKNLIVPSGGYRLPRSPETAKEYTDSAGCTRSQDNLFMDGTAIFTFAITTVPRVIDDLLRKADLAPQDVDWYVYHQANKFMLQNLAARSKIPEEKLVLELADVGNTSASSIPIAIQRWVEAGRIRPGQRLVLVGFGIGYSWAACDLVWG